MTKAQLQKQRAATKRAKLKEKRERRKTREQATKQRRREKRAARAAPKNRLRKWSDRVLACGKCAVCGIGPRPKTNSDGSPKMMRRKVDGKWVTTDRQVVVPLNAHHLLPKERYQEFRFKTINGVALCPVHHKYGRYSAHRNPIWFAAWLALNRPEQYEWCIAHMGQEDYERLKAEASR